MFDVGYLQTAYAVLAMSLQAECKYLMQTVPGVGDYMSPLEEALDNKFLPKLLGLQSISDLFQSKMSCSLSFSGM